MAKRLAQNADVPAPGERVLRTRQRLRLIEACITALHLHGPSRTTVDKVVAIADMSPGIVNFYFETKAALLVAALEHLAVEFEEAVLVPVEALRATPQAALDLLIALYLDPDLSSPRKVSVWYSFWGEASARAEYQAICGKRDVAFFDLVRSLVEHLIADRGQASTDADAVSLGLVGVLEMTWQDIAFREEAEIDRPRARARCAAYLASIFPEGPAPAHPHASRQTLEGSILLVAAELAFAGYAVSRLAEHWPGAHLLFKPGHAPPQTVLVCHASRIACDEATPVDWLAIVQSDAGKACRHTYFVPGAEASRTARQARELFRTQDIPAIEELLRLYRDLPACLHSSQR